MSIEPITIQTGEQFSIDQIKAAWQIAMSNTCQCGKRKGIGWPFCHSCYSTLPVDIRNRLYLMIRRTWVGAYEEAVRLLPSGNLGKCRCGCGQPVTPPWQFLTGHFRPPRKQGRDRTRPLPKTFPGDPLHYDESISELAPGTARGEGSKDGGAQDGSRGADKGGPAGDSSEVQSPVPSELEERASAFLVERIISNPASPGFWTDYHKEVCALLADFACVVALPITRDSARLLEALKLAKENIKTWYELRGASRFLANDTIKESWEIYNSESPEMKEINAAIEAAEKGVKA